LQKVLINQQESADLREHAAEALGGIKDRRAVANLRQALQDPKPGVRFWAAYALGQIGDPRALPELKRLAKTDHAVAPGWWAVKKEAAESIRMIEEDLKSKRRAKRRGNRIGGV
jgi:HEAT repeat protein